MTSLSATSAKMEIYCVKLGSHPSVSLPHCDHPSISTLLQILIHLKYSLSPCLFISLTLVVRLSFKAELLLSLFGYLLLPFLPIVCSVTMKSKSDHAPSLMEHIELPLPTEGRRNPYMASQAHVSCTSPTHSPTALSLPLLPPFPA